LDQPAPIDTLPSNDVQPTPAVTSAPETTPALPQETSRASAAPHHHADRDAAAAPATTTASGDDGDALDVRLAAHAGKRAAGSSVPICASGLKPGSTLVVTVHSTPRVIARIPVGASGAVDTAVRLPEGLEPGAHHLIVTGIGKSGRTLTRTIGFSID